LRVPVPVNSPVVLHKDIEEIVIQLKIVLSSAEYSAESPKKSPSQKKLIKKFYEQKSKMATQKFTNATS
jgi:hypothetical protein